MSEPAIPYGPGPGPFPERPAILDAAEDDLIVVVQDGESTLHRVTSVQHEDRFSVTLMTEQAGSALPAL